MNIVVNNYSNNSYKNNNFKNAINVPMVAEEIFGALPPADQINLSLTCKDVSLSLQSIMNIRLGGVFGSSNIFNKVSKFANEQPDIINEDARNTLKNLIKKLSFDCGVKKPHYDINKIIEWFKSIGLAEGAIADNLTWESLQKLGLLSHEDWQGAVRLVAQELTQAAAQLVQTLVLAQEAEGEELIGFQSFKETYLQKIKEKQQSAVTAILTSNTAQLMQMTLDMQAKAQKTQLVIIIIEKTSISLEEKLIKATQLEENLPVQESGISGMVPNKLHREIIDENLINILSFGKRVNLINYLNINVSEFEDEKGNSVIFLDNFKYELQKLMSAVNNEEMPFPVGMISVFLLDYIQGEIKKGSENAKKCLEKINNLNAKDKKGRTFLHWAVNYKKWEITSLLLKLGASPDIQGAHKITPLHWAACLASEDDFLLFLAKSTDLDAQDDDGYTALYRAVDAKKWKNARLLLEAGANPNLADKLRRAPSHIAAACAPKEELSFFLAKNTNFNAQDDDECAALHWAVSAENWENVRFLLEAGANPNTADKMGRTPLHWAAQIKMNSTIQLFLNKGANINRKDRTGNTSLHLAISKKNIKNAKILLDNNAFIDEKNNFGDTPFHLLVESNDMNLIQLALEKGRYKNLNTINRAGERVLDIALLSNNKKLCLLLLARGARSKRYTGKLFYRLSTWWLQSFISRIRPINIKAY